MSNIFTLDNCDEFSDKLNIDELYERKKSQDQNELALYNKILNRVHVRIKSTSKQQTDQQLCWFLVPEIIIGVPKYNQANCIAYLISKLQQNGFRVRYIHPNLLMISWGHYIPSYVRNEYKKKFGKQIDELGNEIGQNNSETIMVNKLPLQTPTTSTATATATATASKKYNPTSSYKPSGKLF
jgi:Family of unknown function (DUF5759)